MPVRRARIAAPAGSIARTLLVCAEQEAADVIVTGTRDRDRLSLDRLLEGSVAQELARVSRRDVLIVPESGRPIPQSV
jgi:nucleotide-binding universal stress UspA family protein